MLRRRGVLREALDVREPAFLGRELLGLPRRRVHASISPSWNRRRSSSRSRPRAASRRPELGACLPHPVVDLTVGRERDEVRVPREAIEERGLGGRRQQPLALALAVVLDQAGPERRRAPTPWRAARRSARSIARPAIDRARITSPSSAHSSASTVASN